VKIALNSFSNFFTLSVSCWMLLSLCSRLICKSEICSSKWKYFSKTGSMWSYKAKGFGSYKFSYLPFTVQPWCLKGQSCLDMGQILGTKRPFTRFANTCWDKVPDTQNTSFPHGSGLLFSGPFCNKGIFPLETDSMCSNVLSCLFGALLCNSFYWNKTQV
jgi:hypothetical protein